MAEFADGGYWYVVGVVETTEGAGILRTPDLPAGSDYCAWYGTVSGKLYAVVRSPDQIAGINELPDPLVDAVLSAAGYAAKPLGRIKGR